MLQLPVFSSRFRFHNLVQTPVDAIEATSNVPQGEKVAHGHHFQNIVGITLEKKPEHVNPD